MGGMPPRWRNQRDPTGVDTPTAVAASSLETPSPPSTRTDAAPAAQFTGGCPGERIDARPAKFARRARFRAISNSLDLKVLRRPLKSAQYVAVR